MKLSKFIPNQNLVSEIAIPPDLIISVAGSLASHVGRTIGGVYQWLKFLKQYDADFKKIQKDDPEAFAALRSVTSTYGDELKDLIDRYEDRLEAARRPNPNKSIRKADITKFNNAKSDIEKFLSGKIKNDKNVKTILRWIEENMPVDQLRIEGKLYESESNPHQYGAGTRLSSAYTAGKDGKECPVYCRDKTSQGYKAWKRGHDEYKKSKKNEGLPPAKVRRLKLYKHGPAPETVALAPIGEDYTMPNLRNYETSPSPYRKSPENSFEKNIPEPDKEDAKVNGGETKTNHIIKKNEKRNRTSR
jgi:hypothetical protein